MSQLADKFEKELRDKMSRAKKECKYNPTRFNQMLAEYGGIETAKRLINDAMTTGKVSDGFTTLCICNRLDLSVEHSVCKIEYESLFTPEQIAYCKEMISSISGRE